MFEKNGYSRDFIRITVHATNKEANKRERPNRRIIIPYIKSYINALQDCSNL